MTIVNGNLPSIRRLYMSSIDTNAESISTRVECKWSWQDKTNGLVSWNFKNQSNYRETVVLYRSGYYFGGAYWPIFLNNGMTSWATQLNPLSSRMLETNSMPIGIIDFGDGQRAIAFLFTLNPGQSWSVLEGGFSSDSPPSNPIIYGVGLEETGTFCIGYDPKQIVDWNKQTRTYQKGFSPNPNSIKAVMVRISSFAQHIQLFPGDSILDSKCPDDTEPVQESNNNVSPGDIEDILNKVIQKIRNL